MVAYRRVAGERGKRRKRNGGRDGIRRIQPVAGSAGYGQISKTEPQGTRELPLIGTRTAHGTKPANSLSNRWGVSAGRAWLPFDSTSGECNAREMRGRVLRTFSARLIAAGSILLASGGAAEMQQSGRIAVLPTPNGGQAVDARIDAAGTIHLLYDAGDIPYYVRSSDHGATFSEAIPAVDAQARKPGLVFSGWSIAVGGDGTVHVAMSTNNWQVKLTGVPTGLVYARLLPGTKAFTPVRSLNGRPSEGFSLATGRGRDVAATWLADKLFVNFSRDAGATFTPTAELNPAYNPCNCCTTRAAYGADGKLAILYREETNNDRDMYLILVDRDGHSKRTRVSTTPWKLNGCPMTYYSLAATKDGYLAAWPTKGDIYFARLDLDGKVAPPGEVKTPGHSGMRTGIVALDGANGATLIVWKRGEELGWQMYGRDGRAQGPAGSVASQGKGAAAVVDTAGRFLIFR
jgi:hypothetical protein